MVRTLLIHIGNGDSCSRDVGGCRLHVFVEDVCFPEDELDAVGAETSTGGDFVDDAHDVGNEFAAFVREHCGDDGGVHLGFVVVELHEAGCGVSACQGEEAVFNEL